jgi:hypothetical protein
LLILLVFIAIIAAAVVAVYIYEKHYAPITRYNYKGSTFVFRTDLRKANKLTVQPNETSITDLLWVPDISKITIVYKNSTDVNLVTLEAIEITYKLKLGYVMANFPVEIDAQEVQSFDSLPTDRPFIAIVPPSLADETAIKLQDNVIFVEGKNLKELDLATVKFLIVALGIKGIPS